MIWRCPHILAFAVASLVALEHDATATTIVIAGHVDVAVRFQNGELSMESRVGTSPYTILTPNEVALVIPAASLENRRASAAYDAIGVAPGEPFYKLPQGSFEATLEAAPFVGLAAENVANGVFVGNVVRVNLVAVDGPGFFSLWRETATGPGFESRPGFVGVPIASSDGIGPDDFILLPTSLHEHANWGFTTPGRYFVTLAAQGELVGGGRVSAQGTYRFDVDFVPHAADLTGDGLVDRADLASFVRAFGSEGAFGTADFTGDGRVGLADLAFLQAALTLPNPAQSIAAPAGVVCEPTTIWLAFAAATTMIQRRSKKCRRSALAIFLHIRYTCVLFADRASWHMPSLWDK